MSPSSRCRPVPAPEAQTKAANSDYQETDRSIRPWPRQMRAETAARYVDEASTSSFLRSVGTLYPEPRMLPTKGRRWLKEDLDEALNRLHGQAVDERTAPLSDLI